MEPLLSPQDDVLEYLERHERKEILRFVAVGSVDDGKSTLIGRLLHDTKGIYEDQLSAVRRASKAGSAGGEIDFSLFTDGLKAEREQGITIDVAYRYFATEKRKFIIADTPGHVQYTRNMATGASTADVAIILIDARLGVLPQSRRHAFIASLLGIPHLLVGVNKMDLVGYDERVYQTIRKELSAFAAKLDFEDVTFVPISALRGDNIVARSQATPFYEGPTLLEYLETVELSGGRNLEDFRYPVQTVLRPDLHYRGYAGQIASGIVRRGDTVMVLPSRKTSRIRAIDAAGTPLEEAFAPMSVTLRLEGEIDVSRGDMLVHPSNLPRTEQRFDAMVVWLHDRPLDREKSYLLKHTTQTVRAEVESVGYAVDLATLAEAPATELGLNDIGRVTLHTHRPLFVDAYTKNRATGAFILIDSLTNDTVAAGMIQPARTGREVAKEGDASERTQVSPRERRERLGQGGAAIVLEAAGERARAAAFATERLLFDRGAVAAVIGERDDATIVAAVCACVEAGLIAICAAPGIDAALVARLGRGRVVRVEVDARDPEAIARSAARLWDERAASGQTELRDEVPNRG